MRIRTNKKTIYKFHLEDGETVEVDENDVIEYEGIKWTPEDLYQHMLQHLRENKNGEYINEI